MSDLLGGWTLLGAFGQEEAQNPPEGVGDPLGASGKPAHVLAEQLPRVADDQRFLDRLSLYDYDLPFIAVPLMGPNARPIGVLAAQPMARQEERLPACTRFLETVANLVAQTIRLMILPASPALSSRQPPKVERPPACSSSRGVGLDNMVGKSPAMRQIVEVIRQVSRWDTTVLVRGESGTGKELIANAIHHHSPRAGAAFVKFNCAALPDTLLESELFGHEKGAFTGAVRQRKGRFELAAPCSSMRLVKAAHRSRPSCCVSSRRGRWSGSAAMRPCG